MGSQHRNLEIMRQQVVCQVVDKTASQVTGEAGE
jgi:hypothetical protein